MDLFSNGVIYHPDLGLQIPKKKLFNFFLLGFEPGFYRNAGLIYNNTCKTVSAMQSGAPKFEFSNSNLRAKVIGLLAIFSKLECALRAAFYRYMPECILGWVVLMVKVQIVTPGVPKLIFFHNE